MLEDIPEVLPFRCGGRSDISRPVTGVPQAVKLAVIEISGGSPKNKINSAFNIAILV
ncbi:hypothetical protein D3C85_1891610 [compost metagenome]